MHPTQNNFAEIYAEMSRSGSFPIDGHSKQSETAKARSPRRRIQIGIDECSANSSRPSRLRGKNLRYSACGEQRRTAFSFIEVLFAVILLGLGFIMIAGVFPAAIQQTAAVSSETQGNAIIRDAIKKIQAAADAQVAGLNNTATTSLFPVTGSAAAPSINIFPFTPNVNGTDLTQIIGTDGFFTADKRFAWVGFYRRDSLASPFAQVYIVALQNPNFANYTSQYLTGNTALASTSTISQLNPPVLPPIPPNTYNNTPANVVATITAQFYFWADNSTTVMFTGPTVTPTPPLSGASGAFVLVAQSAYTNMVGRFFRLGIPLSTPSWFTPQPNQASQYFQVQPGYDLTASDLPSPPAPSAITQNQIPPMGTPSAAFTASVFMIGAAPTLTPGSNPPFYGGYFTGPNQDIAAGSGFIRLNTANN